MPKLKGLNAWSEENPIDMPELDQTALAAVLRVKEHRLSSFERIAIYAFARRGVPTRILAKVFGVNQASIRYITNDSNTVAYKAAKSAYETVGEAHVWEKIITPAQIDSINQEMRASAEGNIHARRRSRNDRRGPGA